MPGTDRELTDEEYASGELARAKPIAIAARLRYKDTPGRYAPDVEVRQARTQEEADALAPWLPGGANRGGRTDERADRLADYERVIEALHREGFPEAQITVPEAIKRLNRTASQVYADVGPEGGWKAFRGRIVSRLAGKTQP